MYRVVGKCIPKPLEEQLFVNENKGGNEILSETAISVPKGKFCKVHLFGCQKVKKTGTHRVISLFMITAHMPSEEPHNMNENKRDNSKYKHTIAEESLVKDGLDNRFPSGGIVSASKSVPKPSSAMSSAVSTISTLTLTEEVNNTADNEELREEKCWDEVSRI